MPGTLYVVATPIGNLEDITLRALRVLREVAVIAAEDTRRTARLLQHYSISTRTTSLHEHNERTRTPGLMARLAAGESIALVSDAGTPLVSDPGRHLVSTAHAAGYRVEPVPGPSAVMAALSASGLVEGEFLFAGFPPAKAGARATWLARMAAEPRAIVMYEAPHRISATLPAILATFGDRPMCIARETTKAHEELAVRPISAFLADPPTPRGEFTLVIAAPAGPHPGTRTAEPKPDDAEVVAAFDDLTKTTRVGRREGARLVAQKLGFSANEVYQIVLKSRRSAE